MKQKISYKDAGVDIEKTDKAIASSKKTIQSTFTKNVLSSVGGFGSMYSLKDVLKNYDDPIIVQSIDGVGTKMSVAQQCKNFSFIGVDLVNACCNDVAATGAKPITFLDYIACANHLVEQRYTYKGGLCFYGGSAGGLTGGAVANMAPDLFFSMLLLVPFVDTMTTMLNDKLPLTPAEWELWGNPIKSKEYYEYILSYAPYNNLEKKDYPSMLITTSLFDNRVLYSEPIKYIAKLRDVKTDNNTQLLKCKMEAAGHGGMSGRDNAITELAEEYSFILKSAKILK